MIKLNKWLPAIFFLFLWYVPRNTAPGGFFEKYIILRWSTYLVIPLVVSLFLLHRLLCKLKINVANIFPPIVSIFFIILLSGIINGSSPLAMLFTVFTYLRYPLLFIVLSNMEINKDTVRFLIKIFFLLLILQIPEISYRYFVLGVKWDYISWSLGPWGHFDLGVYMMYATALIAAQSLIMRLKMTHIILIFCFFFMALVGEIKAFMFLAPIVIGFIICNGIKKEMPKKRFYAILGLIAVTAIAFTLSFNLYKKVFPETIALEPIENTLQPSNDKALERIKTVLQIDKNGQSRRVSAFSDILGQTKAVSKFLLGWGPGSSFKGNYLAKRGRIYNFSFQDKNQLAESFVDIGLVGMAAYYWFIFCLFLGLRKHIGVENDETYIFLNLGVMGMWFFYAFLGPMYDLVWRHDAPNFIFFFLSAALFSRYRHIKNENTSYK